MTEKKCTKCGLKKPLDAFSKRAASKDGLQFRCKECATADSKAWSKANHEQHRANGARWAEENPEQKRASGAHWRRAHPEQHRAINARWAEKNFERKRATNARWKEVNPEKVRESVRRRRANKRAVSEHFTVEMARFVKAFWNHQCAFCGGVKELCIDHWHPLFRGHALTMSNAVLLCKSCNSSKGRKLLKDLNNQVRVAAVEQQLVEQAERWEVCEQFAISSTG